MKEWMNERMKEWMKERNKKDRGWRNARFRANKKLSFYPGLLYSNELKQTLYSKTVKEKAPNEKTKMIAMPEK